MRYLQHTFFINIIIVVVVVVTAIVGPETIFVGNSNGQDNRCDQTGVPMDYDVCRRHCHLW